MRARRVVAFIAAMISSSALAADYKTVWIDKGGSADIYWEINLAGKVYLAADHEGSPACLDYWWIAWPFGNIKQLGRHCGRVEFSLPGLTSFSVAAKLRAGGADSRTRVIGTSSESVANSFPVKY